MDLARMLRLSALGAAPPALAYVLGAELRFVELSIRNVQTWHNETWNQGRTIAIRDLLRCDALIAIGRFTRPTECVYSLMRLVAWVDGVILQRHTIIRRR